MELWFQVQDAETGAELGPKRQLLSEAQRDRRSLARPEVAKIARVPETRRERERALPRRAAIARQSCDWGRHR